MVPTFLVCLLRTCGLSRSCDLQSICERFSLKPLVETVKSMHKVLVTSQDTVRKAN